MCVTAKECCQLWFQSLSLSPQRQDKKRNKKNKQYKKGTLNVCFQMGLIFLKSLDHYTKTGFDMLWHECFSIHFSHMTSQLGKKCTHPWNRYLRFKKNTNKKLQEDGYFTSKWGMYFLVFASNWYFPLR